jgi:hypothetical protein
MMDKAVKRERGHVHAERTAACSFGFAFIERQLVAES